MTPGPEAGLILEFMRGIGVTRLTHFTSARNLHNILTDSCIRNTREMTNDPRSYFSETDPERFDNHPDKISCSIEYPNGYYLNQARAKSNAINYPDWACFLIDPEVAAAEGVLFSRVNAAQGSGTYLLAGLDGLLSCYMEQCITNARTVRRARLHKARCPTDVQAEVLVPGHIPMSSVHGIAMASSELVTEERARLRRLRHDPDTVRWIVAPDLFDSNAITGAVRDGRDILELPYELDLDPWRTQL